MQHGVDDGPRRQFLLVIGIDGDPAPVRRFLPKLIGLVWTRQINPGSVFDFILPLEQVVEGYRAMDERVAIEALLRP